VFGRNSNSKTPESNRPQHDCPTFYVIAQQYSSVAFAKLCYHSNKQTFGAFENVTISTPYFF
jgi:hypothetical protein